MSRGQAQGAEAGRAEPVGELSAGADPSRRLPSRVPPANQRQHSGGSLSQNPLRLLSARYHENIPPGESTARDYLLPLCDLSVFLSFFVALSKSP